MTKTHNHAPATNNTGETPEQAAAREQQGKVEDILLGTIFSKEYSFAFHEGRRAFEPLANARDLRVDSNRSMLGLIRTYTERFEMPAPGTSDQADRGMITATYRGKGQAGRPYSYQDLRVEYARLQPDHTQEKVLVDSRGTILDYDIWAQGDQKGLSARQREEACQPGGRAYDFLSDFADEAGIRRLKLDEQPASEQ